MQLSQKLNVDMGNTNNVEITKHGFSNSGPRTQVWFVCMDLIFFLQVSVLSSVEDASQIGDIVKAGSIIKTDDTTCLILTLIADFHNLHDETVFNLLC